MEQYSEFFLAVGRGDTNAVSRLIRSYPEQWKEATRTDGQTALHFAPNADITKFLLLAGANVEALDKVWFTPFLRAVWNGHSEIMKLLIERACNVSAKAIDGNGALALASKQGHLHIARELVRMGFSVNEPHQNSLTSLHWACHGGQAKTAKFLISSGANIEAVDKSGCTPLLIAVIQGRLDVMNLLIQGGCSISAKTNDGDGALALASQWGHVNIARRLVGIGCSVDEPHQNEFTSLHWACHNGQAIIAKYLISAGANIEALDKWSCTPFLCAIFEGHLEAMNVLIEHDCNIYARNFDGAGALALASEVGCLDIAKQLVKMGFSANEPHQEGYTSLHWACQEGNARTAEFLISSGGANIEAEDKWGYTPYLRAVVFGHSKIMDVLMKRGCNVAAKNNEGNGALAFACQKGFFIIVRKLLGMGFSVNEPDQNGYTPLHWACRNGHAETAKYLISAGASTEARNKFGRTPLREASVVNQHHVVAALRQIPDSRSAHSRNKESRAKVAESSSRDGRIKQPLQATDEVFSVKDDINLPDKELVVESAADNKSRRESNSRYQEIYDEALKRGSVTVNRSRVIVAGQDGAGKSCLVDSLLNRPFEKDKASTEGAAVSMIHTAASGWVATDSKDHLDPLIAEGVYRMNEQQSSSMKGKEGCSESSHFVIESRQNDSVYDKAEAESACRNGSYTAPLVETLAEDLKAVGMGAKMLSANQQKLVNTFVKSKLSEQELKKHILGVRDIWDLGGQEVYLATHSALMPDSRAFGLSMYMVVMDISKSLSNKVESFHRLSGGEVINQTSELSWIRTNGDFPLYWFGSITAAHEETPMGDHWLGKNEEVTHPPVFAIGSHRDVLGSNKERFHNSAVVEKWLRDQGELFEQLLSDSDFMKHIVLPDSTDSKNFREIAHFVDRIFLIDNSVSGSRSPCEGVNEIRERVDRMTSTYWKGVKKQPLFWVYLEILLFRWAKVMKTTVAKVDEISDLSQHPTICNISSRDEVLVALEYLANVGAILYYPDVSDLKDVVFTRPMWVIRALSTFVTAAKPRPYMEPKWNTLKKEGIMSDDLMKYRLKQMRDADSSDLAAALGNSDRKVIEEENRMIVRLLELLDVITPVEGSRQSKFYVPSMLKTSFLYSSTHWERLTLSDSDSSCRDLPAPLVVIPKRIKFVPECLFFRLITRFLKLYPNKPRLSRHQCIFLVQDEYSLVEVEVELLYHKRGKWVALTIHFINEGDTKKMSVLFLASIKNQLRKQMQNVCQQGMRGFKYMICCQTKKTVCKDEEFGIDFQSLPVIINEECDYSPKIPRLYNPFDEPLAVKQEEFLRVNCWFKRQSIEAVLSSQNALPKVINASLTRVVANLVKAKWEELAVFLGREAYDIPQYREKSKGDLLRAIMVIEDWERECGQEATVTALIHACEHCGIHKNNIEAAYTQKS